MAQWWQQPRWLCTGTFALIKYAVAGVGNFPLFLLGCLIAGGMMIISLKQKIGAKSGQLRP